MAEPASPRQTSVHQVSDVDLPALDVYRHLKDRELKIREGLFIAEGMEVVRRLMRSRLETHSLLVTERKLARLGADVPTHVPVYVATIEQMESIAGFWIHRGIVACGVRPRSIDLETAIASAGDGRMVAVLQNICDAQNVGVIIRNAAAFGADLVILAGCCDPYYRRAIRVSMGNVFNVPLYATECLVDDLEIIRDRLRLELVAAEPGKIATPLDTTPRNERTALLFGSERDGLSPDVLAVCDRQVGVPMAPGTDSVNVAVASGIFLYAYSCASPSTRIFSGSMRRVAASE